ncbi:S-adenosylmethionine:tRNA ribosyltransferase-isomerase [Peribacillus sp. SCS-155]|uniref:S-adenosylmethionine:tRNA ribosyltransferase-isomerase n=1 Tax=Peribacillus sedimenti TaxID=3115297 RepID=UPI003906A447
MAAIKLNFALPSSLNATTPPERRGVRRDHVRMMEINRFTGAISHDDFYNLANYLKPGDLIVLNNSRTIPAILYAQLERESAAAGPKVQIRLAHRKSKEIWEVQIVSDDVRIGDVFSFSSGLTAEVIERKMDSPFSILCFSKGGQELLNEIYRIGEPVRYEYISTPWNLDYYQTVFASVPGSVEMPSAGRAFSWELLFKLQKKGINIAYLQLHTGLSYLLDDKWHIGPDENLEEYKIPQQTMDSVLRTKGDGGRIIAAGTTVVRALETAVASQKLQGWTNLYIDSSYELKLVDGIITGFHEPEASHLDMLSAFIQKEQLFKAYQQAVEEKYLWHEFGDVNLIL